MHRYLIAWVARNNFVQCRFIKAMRSAKRFFSTFALVIASAVSGGCRPLPAHVTAPVQHSPDEPSGAQSRPSDQARWTTQSDDWYSLTLAGTRAGWMRVVREDDGNRYRTANEMTLEFHHAGTDLNADSYAEWTESHDGQPLHLVVARKDKTNLANSDIGKPSVWEKTRDGDPQSLLTSKHEWEFNGPRATQIIHRDNELVRLPDFIPNGEWLTPAAAERFIHRQISENAAAMEYGTLEASDTLRVVHVHSTLVGPSDFAFDGRMIPVTVWSTGTSASAAQATSHYSHDGKLVYSSNDLGIGVLETRMCRKDVGGGGSGPSTARRAADYYPVVKLIEALIA